MTHTNLRIRHIAIACLIFLIFGARPVSAETAASYSYMPPFLTNSMPPQVMLTMARDHRLYYEAYNDASDINEDGILDVGYNPTIDYYGYFDSYKLYDYVSARNRFEPVATTTTKKNTTKSEYWSGNFLNYVTMTRMDCLRKVLYGGFRSVDTETETVLRRVFIPQDAHSFGKEYDPSRDSYDIRDYTNLSTPMSGRRHLFASTTRTSTTSDPLLLVLTDKTERIWQWVSKERPVADNSLGTPTSYVVEVLVGVSSMPEDNCKLYPNGTYKPVGILQRYGETEKMHFGLLTGSYEKNMAGGVLRKNIGPIHDEINTTTGQFTSTNGIISTISKLRISDFSYSSPNFEYRGGWEVVNPMSSSTKKFPDWGNPLAEMIYETARYFSGSTTPTSEFTYGTGSTLVDNALLLPKPNWIAPFNSTNYCAKPVMVAISDIFPSYDSDHLPGSQWPVTISSSLGSLNVSTVAEKISNHEGVNGSTFIGQAGTNYDGACSPKNITGLHNIRGLCQEEPTKQGSYYSGAVAHYAATQDLNPSIYDTQSMSSYMVALSSPLPEIRIPIGDNIISLVPFGKTVHTGVSGFSAAAGAFQPTLSIVDFYVENSTADNSYGKFRINFEDVEQGADHDMDVIVSYEYWVQSDNTLKIKLTKEYQAAGYNMHIGYIITGTGSTTDGVYLDIASKPTNDPLYYLDTPTDRLTPGRGGSTLRLSNGITGDNTVYSRERTFTPSNTPAAQILKNPLWYAAKWGGFEDSNGNGIPDLQEEWDKDGDGIPDNYFYVANPLKLEEQLNKAFSNILSRVSSGTAASVISQSRSGEGAVYQSIFYPEYPNKSGITTMRWAGQVHSLFVDSRGNIREDSNNNQQLDLIDDKIVIFDSEKIYLITDNGDSIISEAEFAAKTPVLQTELKYIWTSSKWLNEIADASVTVQRPDYANVSPYRYIFTFADKNQNMLVDHNDNEQQAFVWPATEPTPGLVGVLDYYAYLTLYPSFEHTPPSLDSLRTSNLSAFNNVVNKLAHRQVHFIRGKDIHAETVGGYSLNATRTRAYEDGATIRTWRLGDVVHSTPTVVGRPSENYHLLYGDRTYESFLKKYRDRRQVVYVGANDGMLHAFNGGFYKSTSKSFVKQLSTETPFELGQELWAYIPYNLLPHLYWLTERDYGKQLHVSYMDSKPRIFDARVFFNPDGTPSNNSTHPDGWGTLLVAGMRLGGGLIRSDMNKTDGNLFVSGTDRTMTSAYVIMDITDPEQAPKVLAEIAMPKQGFTTCYPTAMPMSSAGATIAENNQWYLVFGSGPADAAGKATPEKIQRAVSDQPGQLYVLDLKALVSQKKIVTLDGSSKQFKEGAFTFVTTENGSFISDPVAVDLDIGSANKTAQFKADAVYYGTVADDEENGRGTIRRLLTANELPDTSGLVNWTGDSVLINVQQPITAAPSVALDDKKRMWVYFGTGRFFNRTDLPQNGTMEFYGVKEPISGTSGPPTWSTVNLADLYNSTAITLDNGTCVGGSYSASCVGVKKNGAPLSGGWQTLISEVDAAEGWRHAMPNQWERVLGQAAVLGGVTLFTSYTPSDNLCEFEGTSDLWALYYKTGTPFYRPILKGVTGDFAKSVSLGKGLALTPNIHIGESGTSKAFIQTSTGAIETVEIVNPLNFKSGTIFWRQNIE